MVYYFQVKMFSEQKLLKCDVFCMKGNVRYTWIYYLHQSMVYSYQLLILFCIRCGNPCAHVLKLTNELTLDMIKVQHWKLYAMHYNDEFLGIGLELNKLQFQYSHYECMGVSTTWEIIKRSQRQSNHDLFPYYYDRITEDEYKSALAVESMGCCVAKIEYAQSNGIEEEVISVLIYFVQ